MIEQDIKGKINEVYEVLPKLNDRRCGYRTCGEFARAVVKGEAPCYGCVSGGYEIAKKVCNIMGEKVGDEEKVSSEYNNRARNFVGRFGRGRGYRNRYYTISFPRGSRYKSVTPARSGTEAGYNYYSTIYHNQRMDTKQERIMLKRQADSIGKQLDDIEERISKLEKDGKK